MIVIKGLGSNALITQGFGVQLGAVSITGEVDQSQLFQILFVDGRISGTSSAYAAELKKKRLNKKVVGEVHQYQRYQESSAFGDLYEPIFGEVNSSQNLALSNIDGDLSNIGSVHQRQFRQRLESIAEVQWKDSIDDEEFIFFLMAA